MSRWAKVLTGPSGLFCPGIALAGCCLFGWLVGVLLPCRLRASSKDSGEFTETIPGGSRHWSEVRKKDFARSWWRMERTVEEDSSTQRSLCKIHYANPFGAIVSAHQAAVLRLVATGNSQLNVLTAPRMTTTTIWTTISLSFGSTTQIIKDQAKLKEYHPLKLLQHVLWCRPLICGRTLDLDK